MQPPECSRHRSIVPRGHRLAGGRLFPRCPGRSCRFLVGVILQHGHHRVNAQNKHFPYVGMPSAHTAGMAASMQKQLGQYLRKRRGEMTLPAFARKLGISSSSLHRMEMGDQNVTITTLERLLKRLKCSLTDVFDTSENLKR